MRAGVALLLALAGLVALAGAFAFAQQRHAFDGCLVAVASEASAPVSYEVRRGGDVHAGTLAPGAEKVERLCWLAPDEGASARVVTARGNLTVALDPFCSDPRVVVNDTAARLEARTCEG